MQIENSFSVQSPPERVYDFLLDVNSVVGCVPGAELSEVLDADTFKGKVKIKVGPVTVNYNGTARITGRDASSRTATLRAEGRETTGSGSAQASTTMSVTPEGDGSKVTLATEFTVVGRIAQFGRGLMEDVSRHLIAQMADCIRETLEAPQSDAASGAGGSEPEPASGDDGSPAPAGTASRPRISIHDSTGRAPASAPLDALALGRKVAIDRVSRIQPARVIPIVVAVVLAFLLLRRVRRRKRG